MEATLKMPAAYAVMDSEEMTYTDGGATTAQALCSWFVPFYGWYKGLMAVRSYRKAHPDDWIDSGLSALSADMEKSTANLFYDLGNAFHVVGMCGTGVGLLINAVVIFA